MPQDREWNASTDIRLAKQSDEKLLLYSIQVIQCNFHVLKNRVYELENPTEMIMKSNILRDNTKLSVIHDFHVM